MIQIRIPFNLTLIVCISLISPLTYAATIHVPADQRTIQAGIDIAQNGDTVLVDDGVYRGEGNVNIDFKGKRITLKSKNGADATAIDCEKLHETRGFYFYNEETNESVLDGFTITNGSHQFGGSITLVSASPTIKNCVVKDNLTLGIHCINSDLIILDSIISHNIGIGVAISGIDILTGEIRDGFIQNGINMEETFIKRPTIKNCTISNNTGIGISCLDDGATIVNCTVSKNGGRGISVISFTSAEITDSRITQNSGGGLKCSEYSRIRIKNSIIDKNTAEDGGGVFCSPTSSLYATDCVIANNTALKNGGGIWDLTRFGDAFVKHCTITQNSAGNKGGGIYVTDRGHLNMTNSIVWDNTSDGTHAEVFAWGILTIKSCNIKDGLDGIERKPDGRLFRYEDNIDADPLFVNAKAGDYALQPNSPAAGMGVRDPEDQEPIELKQDELEENNQQENKEQEPRSVSHRGKQLVKWADLKRKQRIASIY
ncbi:MAG: right-handed parallel beta-helix repeat-containing protein [Candidatus Poribacteria bacterium]|nr:right-handed parallel beta-helix repeat-containing protein [Candidatus Poribacteria bacterium]